MAALLEVSSVDQVFRTGFWLKRQQILHDIQLNVPAGTICGFLGSNGAGKTTLIQLIVGLRRPTRGTILIGGQAPTLPVARARIGYLPERPYFHEHLTAEGMLRYYGALSGMGRVELMGRIPRVLGVVGLLGSERVELRKFSKGMLQRIGIAQAILHDPEFLVLDEPMSGLDPLGRKEMRELILALKGEGRTIFFSSHVIPDVESICDQIALIRKGRMLGFGPIGQFLAQGTLQTEIAFNGISLETARGIPEFESVREIPDGCRAIAAGQRAANAALAKLLALKANVLWMTPVRHSLEELFVSEKSGS